MSNNRRRLNNSRLSIQNIPEKANTVLNWILIAFILVVLRIWHLAIIQYDAKLEEARKPQKRVIIEPSKRATIRDRFNIPLAVNKIHYQAGILYSQLKHIPTAVWEKDSKGKRIKRPKRKEYIKNLSQMLGKELQLDAERLEDLIHSKGAFYGHIPLIIKDEITEQEYYRLKMLERYWPGIQVQRIPKRDYPQGKVAGDIIGYMGAIDKKQYESVLHEIQSLKNYINEREEGNDPPLPVGIGSYQEAKKRLRELRESSYSIHDYVGKTGIEGRFEQQLRGFHGSKSYTSDAKGNFLREMPGAREPLSGQRILLTISSELQEYAEKLLAQNERIREGRISGLDANQKNLTTATHPWIKGGAIVAMDPKTGEVLALASYPRFDPNDFIASGGESQTQRRSNISRWFETEAYIGEIWDQKRPLERERFDEKKQVFFEESFPVHWDNYLRFILPEMSPVHEAFTKMRNISQVIELEKNIDRLLIVEPASNLYGLFNILYPYGSHHGGKMPREMEEKISKYITEHPNEIAEIKMNLNPYFENLSYNYDKVLFIDLCRVAVDGSRFSDSLVQKIGKQPLAFYRDVSAASVMIQEVIKEMTKQLFHEIHFKIWRNDHEKEYLKSKRQEEKLNKAYPKPYTDYLDRQEIEMFDAFWTENKWKFLAAFLNGKQEEFLESDLAPYFHHFSMWRSELEKGAHAAVSWRNAYRLLEAAVSSLNIPNTMEYLQTLRGYDDLNRPLFGKYRYLRKQGSSHIEKNLAAAFYPKTGFGYGRSQCYRQAATQGSLFKLVTSYKALIQQYNALKNMSLNISPDTLNPLEITDQIFRSGKDLCVGFTEDGKPIPQLYKGGRLLKSASKNIGKIDLLKAIKTSSNPYFSLLAGDVLHSPNDLAEAAHEFGYGSRTGIDIPLEIAGKVPTDLETNRTGLYAMANGQHSLVVTPLQTSVMLSAIANKGKILKPKIVNLTAGRQFNEKEGLFDPFPNFPYEESLGYVGIDFPLFSGIHPRSQNRKIERFPTLIKRELFMPNIVQKILLEGMRQVVQKQVKDGLSHLSRIYQEYPEAISDLIDVKNELLGKTSTSEMVENLNLDIEQGTHIINHVWFGAIAYDHNVVDNEYQTLLYKDDLGDPELVVVVYLKFGAWGKEAAPLGAQIVKKWREIKEAHKQQN